MQKPLEGFKVVELATYVAVPSAARLLADWGAEVVKIETVTGDAWRNIGRTSWLPIRPDCNPIYSKDNSGKKFISLDLKNPEGLEILHKLLAEADVFMSSVRYGGLTRLGLDYDTLHAKYPGLVYAHFNGYGAEGPDAEKPGFDHTGFWGRSGAFHEVRDIDGRPTIPPGGFGDTASANALAGGIVAALFNRTRTGEGMRLATSLYANSVWCNYQRIISSQDRPDGSEPFHGPFHVRDRKNPFGCPYRCKDDTWFLMLGGDFSKYADTMRVLGLDELVDDERFKPGPEREKHLDEMYDIMEEAFLKKTASEWDVLFRPLDISSLELKGSAAVSTDEQAWANEFLTHMECPDGTTWVMPNSPITFQGVEKTHTKHAGPRGSDNEDVLKQYGYSDEEIRDLYARGVISAAQ